MSILILPLNLCMEKNENEQIYEKQYTKQSSGDDILWNPWLIAVLSPRSYSMLEETCMHSTTLFVEIYEKNKIRKNTYFGDF